MSVRLISEVFARYPNGGGEMLLALALADHASDDGTRVYPSVKALAEKTRQSERTVQYQLRAMEAAGWLILVGTNNGGRSKTTEYRISPLWLKGADIAPFQKGAIHDIKGADSGTKGCNPRHERVQHAAPASNRQEPLEPLENREAPAAAAPAIPSELLNDFLAVRKAKRAGPLTATALKAIQREADKAGIALADAITYCCEAGWQGFNAGWYAERTQGNSRVVGQGETAYQRSMRERMQEAAPAIARRAPGTTQAADFFNTVEAPVRRLGVA